MLKTCIHKLLCGLNAYCTFEPATRQMAKIYFSTGSNQGNRLLLLAEAATLINRQVGRVMQYSQVFETEPWGFDADTSFFNQVLVVDTNLGPHEVLEQILLIEQALGRKRIGNGYSSRTMDIDILFYDDLQLADERLVIPHPELHKRKFVLFPLAEVAPGLIHPVTGTSVAELLNGLQDNTHISVAAETNEFARLFKP